MTKGIPVILDTDIGSDMDDTWALAMMLKSPELDIKLITTGTGDTTYRAKIVAKMLEIAGRTDIPIGIGIDFTKELEMRGVNQHRNQLKWVENYDLASYPGKVFNDGVCAIVDTIMNSPEQVTLICIGPVPNIAKALELEPRIADRARFVGMFGSVRRGYGGNPKISAECNVVCYTKECRKVFEAAWDITITPLDTCDLVKLEGDKYQRILSCQDPLIKAIIENYRIWDHPGLSNKFNPDLVSSILFDTVAIHLAYSQEFLEMETLGLRVTDDGFTVIDENAKKIHCAMNWKDLPAYEDYLVERLLS
jgi:inosine-uridine nucleoside N-ribohydrolase